MIGKGLTAHMLVKNEERWIWFSIMSIIKFVDKILIYDTGSTDKTTLIIEDILETCDQAYKIQFEKRGSVDKNQFTRLRQEQIERTTTEWFMVADGDEIWYENVMLFVKKRLEETNKQMLAIKFHNCVKDVYHHSDYTSGSYKIIDEVGNITIKFISMNIKGLCADGPYGVEGYFDETTSPIQNNHKAIEIIDDIFLHTSNLIRSKNLFNDWLIEYRRNKVFASPERKVNKHFKFPEVFYLSRPRYVRNPLKKAGISYYVCKALIQPLRLLNFIKRKTF